MKKSHTANLRTARHSLFAVLGVMSISTAMAYVDPGTGSMMLQMGLAAIAGALFYFRQLRMQFVDWFRRTVLRKPADAIVADEQSPSHDAP